MSALEPIIIAVACFSAVPMPFVEWNERNMRHMFAALPLVGVLVGAGLVAWSAIADALVLGPFARGVGFAVVPFLVTGGIHMDGFADVADAHSSHAAPERKRQILKDPHVGAFAVMAICAYLLAYAALASELTSSQVLLFACTPVISRCLCALASLTWPLSSTTGMLATMRTSADKRGTCITLCLELALAAALMVLIAYCTGSVDLVAGLVGCLVTLAAAGLVYLRTRRFCIKEFGGMSGDLSGFLLQTTELVMLACLVVVGRLV